MSCVLLFMCGRLVAEKINKMERKNMAEVISFKSVSDQLSWLSAMYLFGYCVYVCVTYKHLLLLPTSSPLPPPSPIPSSSSLPSPSPCSQQGLEVDEFWTHLGGVPTAPIGVSVAPTTLTQHCSKHRGSLMCVRCRIGETCVCMELF